MVQRNIVEVGAAVVFTWMVILSILGQGVAVPASAQEAGADIIVDANGGGDYTTIQKAIDSAEPGDTIQVREGLYKSNLYIDKPLTLQGDIGGEDVGPGPNAPVISGQGNNVSGITVGDKASNITIEGFEIRNFSFHNGTGGRGITFDQTGIQNIVIRDNYIHNTGWTAVVAAPPGTAGASNYTISNNRISDFATFGIRLANVDQSQIINNQIKGTDGWPKWHNSTTSAVGILVESKLRENASFATTNVQISGNAMSGHLWSGISVNSWNTMPKSAVSMADVTVQNNEITDTKISRGLGVGSQGANASITNTLVIDNKISVGSYGVVLFEYEGAETAELRVEKNTITAGKTGLYTWKTVEKGDFDVTSNDFGPSEIGVLIPRNTTANGTIIAKNSFGNQSDYGVFNNGTGILNATNNWWGASSGPSSPDPQNPVSDPFTKALADGTGENVSERVHFDPWLASDPTTPPVVIGKNPPKDPDSDGLYEDLNGDGAVDFSDPVGLAFNLNNPNVQPQWFDFDGDGDVDFDDAVTLAFE